MEAILCLLPSYINIGTLGRLSLTNKAFLHLLEIKEYIFASFLYSDIAFVNYNISRFKQCKSRYRECGRTRRIDPHKLAGVCSICTTPLSQGCACPGLKMIDTRICTGCAIDDTNYHFMLQRKQIYAFVLKNSRNRQILKKTALERRLPHPRMMTQRGNYLYSPRDIMQIALSV